MIHGPNIIRQLCLSAGTLAFKVDSGQQAYVGDFSFDGKQIEKVVVDGDSALLEVRNGPDDVDQVPLAKTKDGWKVTTR